MANTGSTDNSKQKRKRTNFLNVIFSWSVSDVLNKHLYKPQVKEVPLTFSSTAQYMNSFIYLLLEETRADLSSHLAEICQAPASPIYSLQRSPTGKPEDMYYHINLNGMMYEPRVGDLVAFTQVKPKCIDDLARSNRFFLTAYVTEVFEDSPMEFIVLSSHDLIETGLFGIDERPKCFVIYLTNLTTNMRMWNALNPDANMNVIETTLSYSSSPARDCGKCCTDSEKSVIDLKLRQSFDSFKLDTSQEAAVLSCLAAKKCCHETSCTKLIWGPPGTGKTKTVASLLFVLLRMKHRTLTCALTNIAVLGVAKRLLSLLSDHDLGCDTYGLGDIVLFGNEERMKIDIDHRELLDVFLDNRINVLGKSLSLWETYTIDMIRLLENPMKEYRCLVPKNTKAKSKKENEQKPANNHKENPLTFEEFIMNRFSGLSKSLTACIRNLYTHLPTSVIPLNFAKKMNHLVDLIQKFGESVKEIVTRNQSLNVAFNIRVKGSRFVKLRLCRTECLQSLKDLRAASIVPKSMNKFKLKEFCLRYACLIFCTASSSIKLCGGEMTPIQTVLIDEAAQLKECESIIPLHLPGVRNAVLVGDERQLPAMVQSKVVARLTKKILLLNSFGVPRKYFLILFW